MDKLRDLIYNESMKKITSRNNEIIKSLKKLNQKKYRDKEEKFLLFGEHLVEKARKEGILLNHLSTKSDLCDILVSEDVIKVLSPSKTIYKDVGVGKIVQTSIKNKNVLLLSGIQDPENIGAIIRSAVAFDFLDIYASFDTADIYTEKVSRSSQGAILDIFYKRCDLSKEIKNLKEKGYKICAADAHIGGKIKKSNTKLALLLGSEGKGISSDLKEKVDEFYNIKTNNVESLNVAVAASIILYELAK